MQIKFVKDFAQQHEISEIFIRNILIQSFSLAATNKFKEFDFLLFNFENDSFFCYKDEMIIEKPIKEMGRSFLLTNCDIYFKFLLNAVYPEKFNFKGNASDLIQEIYEKRNIENYRAERSEEGRYCSACMQAPCMCSDRERSSMTDDF